MQEPLEVYGPCPRVAVRGGVHPPNWALLRRVHPPPPPGAMISTAGAGGGGATPLGACGCCCGCSGKMVCFFQLQRSRIELVKLGITIRAPS